MLLQRLPTYNLRTRHYFQKKKKTTTTTKESLEVYDPHRVGTWDVLCDRYDERCMDHVGNRRFAILVCMFMTKGQDLFDVSIRIRIARAIIHTIHTTSANPTSTTGDDGDDGDQKSCRRYRGGRFLAKTKRNTWKEIDETLAIKWISLILKTAAHNVKCLQSTTTSTMDSLNLNSEEKEEGENSNAIIAESVKKSLKTDEPAPMGMIVDSGMSPLLAAVE
mmetsp:Transcript_3979/g.6806  ORF Transcript_3979/g.6806 Transcript_3979/m.6806 type:complete len:220 (-) Transcript_3979:52-711(-)